MSNNTHIYTGVWIDWTQGAIRGATFTLSQKRAGLLTAFLAVLVSSAGSLFWNIIAFVIHQAYTTEIEQKRDVLHHKRQVILRNKGTVAAAWSLLVLPFAHRSMVSKRFLRSLPFAIFAIFTILFFGISGLFTSYISKYASNFIVIISPDCGGFEYDTTDGTTWIRPGFSKPLLDTYDAATYVRQCYQENPNGPHCETFARPYLPFITDSNAICPFGGNLCAYNDQSAFQMDTGQLDSHMDFGINAPPHNRIKFRRVCTCAPIRHDSGLVTTVNDSTHGEKIYVYAGGSPSILLNYTFEYTPISNLDTVGYALDAVSADADPTGRLHTSPPTWEPDPRFKQTDADITLMMLAQKNIQYLEPSDDPWITAQRKSDNPVTYPGTNGTNITLNIWSKSYTAYVTEAQSLGFSSYQIGTISRFFGSTFDTSMWSNVEGRGGAALNASMMTFLFIQPYIPPNQWQIEVSTWFATSLAKQQSSILEWAAGPKNLHSAGWRLKTPDDAVSLLQCYNQLVPRTLDYENFSILGLIVTLLLCGVIVIIGQTIDTVVGWLRRGKLRYMREQWEMEETLVLHKAAYLSRGLWRENEEGMPPSSELSNPSSVTIPLRVGEVEGEWRNGRNACPSDE